MATEFAAGYLTLIPSLKGASRQITSQLSGIDTSSAGSKIGQQLSSSIGAGLNLQTVGSKISSFGGAISDLGSKVASITKPANIAASALAAVTLGSGLKRLTDIDTAQAKLKGLGLSAEGVQSVMDSALKSVKGTAYGLGDAASVAAGLAAAGVQQGSKMTSVLSTVADVAAMSGRSMSDVGTIFNSVAARGKLQGDDMLQLMSSGVPVLQLLANHFGTTSAAVSDMVSSGKVSFEDFSAAMQEGLGGSALAAGDTFMGALMNVKAAAGRLGAGLLQGVFPAMKSGLGSLTSMIDGLVPAAERVGTAIGGLVALITQGDFTAALRESLGWEEDTPIVGKILGIREAFVGLFDLVGKGNFSEAFRNAFNVEEDSPIVGVLLSVHDNLGKIIGVAAAAAVGLAPVLKFVGGAVSAVGSLTSFVGSLSTAWGAAAAGGGGFISTLMKFMGPIGLIGSLITALVISSPQLQAALGGAFQAIFAIIGQLAAVLIPVGQQLMASLLPVLTTVGDSIAVALNAIVPTLTMVAAMVAPMIQQIATAILPLVTMLVSTLTPAIQSILGVVTTVFMAIAPIVQGAMTVVQGVIDVVLGIISGNWGQVWNGILAILTGIWGVISGVVSGAISVVGSVLSAGLSVIVSLWNAAWGLVVGLFSGVWNGLKSAASSGISAVIGFFRGLPGQIQGVFAGAGSWLVSAGQNIVQGLLNGVKNLGSKIGSFFLNLLPGWIQGPFKAALGIHSPSTVFAGYGKNIAQGLVNGVDAQQGAVESSISSMADSVSSGFAATAQVGALSPQFAAQVQSEITAMAPASSTGGRVSTQTDQAVMLQVTMQNPFTGEDVEQVVKAHVVAPSDMNQYMASQLSQSLRGVI